MVISWPLVGGLISIVVCISVVVFLHWLKHDDDFQELYELGQRRYVYDSKTCCSPEKVDVKIRWHGHAARSQVIFGIVLSARGGVVASDADQVVAVVVHVDRHQPVGEGTSKAPNP